MAEDCHEVVVCYLDEGDDVHEGRCPVLNKQEICNPVFEVGMEFKTKDEFRKAIQSHAIQTKRSLHIVKNDLIRVYARCRSDGCDWGINLCKRANESTFRIGKYKSAHKCEPTFVVSNLNSKWLAERFESAFQNHPARDGESWRKYMMRELKVDVSPLQIYRAKRRALNIIEGLPDEQYSKLRVCAEKSRRGKFKNRSSSCTQGEENVQIEDEESEEPEPFTERQKLKVSRNKSASTSGFSRANATNQEDDFTMSGHLTRQKTRGRPPKVSGPLTGGKSRGRPPKNFSTKKLDVVYDEDDFDETTSSDDEDFVSDGDGFDDTRDSDDDVREVIFNPSFEVGKVFETKDELKEAVQSHAIQTKRSLHIAKNDKIRVYVRCRGDCCDWGLNLSKRVNESKFQIIKYNPAHKCAPTFTGSNLSNNLNNSSRKAESLRKYIMRELNVNVSKQQALKIIEGLPDEQYSESRDCAKKSRKGKFKKRSSSCIRGEKIVQVEEEESEEPEPFTKRQKLKVSRNKSASTSGISQANATNQEDDFTVSGPLTRQKTRGRPPKVSGPLTGGKSKGRPPKNFSTKRLDFDETTSSDDEDFVCDGDGNDDTRDSDDDVRESRHPVFNNEEIYNPSFEVGMVFETKDEFKEAVKSHAIQTKRSLHIAKNDKIRVYVRCRGDCCEWGINLSKIVNDSKFQILKYNPAHRCAPTFTVRNLNSKWVAERYVSAFLNDPNREVESLRKYIMRELKVNVSKPQVYRARRKVLDMIEGLPDEQYSKLRDCAKKSRRGTFEKRSSSCTQGEENVQVEEEESEEPEPFSKRQKLKVSQNKSASTSGVSQANATNKEDDFTMSGPLTRQKTKERPPKVSGPLTRGKSRGRPPKNFSTKELDIVYDEDDFDETTRSDDEDIVCDGDGFGDTRDSGDDVRELRNPVSNNEEIFNPSFEVGKVFETKDEFKEAVKSHAMETKRSLHIAKNDKIRVYVRCRGDCCEWGINLSKIVNDSKFQIIKYNPAHRCAPTFTVKNLKSTWLGERYVSAFQNNPTRKVEGLREFIMRELNVNVSKQQAYRARRKALEIIEGLPDEQYSKLRECADVLSKENLSAKKFSSRCTRAAATEVNVQVEEEDSEEPVQLKVSGNESASTSRVTHANATDQDEDFIVLGTPTRGNTSEVTHANANANAKIVNCPL